MDLYRRYSLAIGFFVLACIIVLLVSSPGPIFSRRVSFIDTELHWSSGNEAYVKTKIDFGDNEHMQAFPKEIEDWQGSDYDIAQTEEYLGADVMLMRGYHRPGLYQPIVFLIMQAKTESSFHAPPICYRSLGYEIEEEGKEEFLVSDTSWAEEGASSSNRSIPVKKLVVVKESDGKVTERRVVLYYYVEGNQFTSNTITMVRVSALAPIEGSYESILEVEKDFAALTFPYMFELGGEGETETVLAQLTGAGVGGYLAVAVLFSIPLAIIIYPRTRGLRRSSEESEPQK